MPGTWTKWRSQSPSAANKWSYISAPKLQCVYTLSLSHSTSHPPVPTGKGLGESGLPNTTDQPGCLSSQAHMATHGRPAYLLVLCCVSPCDYGSPRFAAEFPITLSLLAFGPTRSCLLLGFQSQPCEGVLESRNHPMTRPKQERLTNTL